MENVTDFLTKQNREHFQDRPIIKNQLDMFRKNKLQLYKNTLANDYNIRVIAEDILIDIYIREGYKNPTD